MLRRPKTVSVRGDAKHTSCNGLRIALLTGVSFVFAVGVPNPADAQQVVANTGQSETASGTIDTGTTAGSAGYALWANGGTITSTGDLELVTGGSSANAARAENGGTITISNPSTITTTGSSASGVSADTGGSVTISNLSTITTTASFADGVQAVGSGSTVTVSAPSTIATNGGSDAPVRAYIGGSITISGTSNTPATLTTSGSSGTVNAAGLVANGAGSTVDATYVNYSGFATGVFATAGGSVTLSNSSIETSNGTGLQVWDPDTKIVATNVDVTADTSWAVFERGASAPGIGQAPPWFSCPAARSHSSAMAGPLFIYKAPVSLPPRSLKPRTYKFSPRVTVRQVRGRIVAAKLR